MTYKGHQFKAVCLKLHVRLGHKVHVKFLYSWAFCLLLFGSGSELSLTTVVLLLAVLSGSMISFQATGSTLPPWRHCNSMLSKWQPKRSVDVPIPVQHQWFRSCMQSKAGTGKSDGAKVRKSHTLRSQ